MNRYHIKTGFNMDHIDMLLSLTMIYNTLNWHYTPHCIDNIKNRFMEINFNIHYLLIKMKQFTI